MRVIAGTYGGRRLRAPRGPQTRPVTDRVKEAVFSSLGPEVPGSEIVDLYAGSGAFGIEALSRGARHAVFVESGRDALAALRDNLAGLGVPSDTFAVEAVTVERYLDAAATGPCVHVAFCDPPWPLGSIRLAEVLEALSPRLCPGAAVVVSRRASDTIPEPVDMRIDADRRYGDTRIIRYRKESS
jgi:16S rRNA (guanine966-N2)-methyltransferase